MPTQINANVTLELGFLFSFSFSFYYDSNQTTNHQREMDARHIEWCLNPCFYCLGHGCLRHIHGK